MPYIKQEVRDEIDPIIDPILKQLLEITTDGGRDGNLNYVITKLLLNEIDQRGKSYCTYNALSGVLSCCDKELYRRVTAIYEDEKIELNGDVL